MSENESDSADDERSVFSKILRRSADELDPDEQTDDQTEQRADDGDDEEDDEMDDTEQAADPIDRALEDGTIEAAQASRIREVADRMSEAGVETLVGAISENDLDVEDAVDMIEAYEGDEPADMDDGPTPPGDDEDNGELRADIDGDALAELEDRLDTVADLDERLSDIESRLDDLADEAVAEDDLEQRLEAVGEGLDEEFEDLIQRADFVGSPSPKTGEADGAGLRESLGISGGD